MNYKNYIQKKIYHQANKKMDFKIVNTLLRNLKNRIQQLNRPKKIKHFHSILISSQVR